MTSVVQSAEGKVLLQAALDASNALRPLDEDYLRQIQAGDIKAAKDTLLERSRPAQLALIAALQKLVDHEIEHIHGRADEIAAAYHSALMFLIMLSLRRGGCCLRARVADHARHQETAEPCGRGARRDREGQLRQRGDGRFEG